MTFTTKALSLALILAAGTAFAAGDRTDPNAKARSDLMKMVGMNTKALGDMAGGKADFDAAAAAAAKAGLIEAAGKIAMTFETEGDLDPASEAKPEIWSSWDDFVKKADALSAAANAIDVSSLDTVKAGMGAIGGSCKDCHTAYRVQN